MGKYITLNYLTFLLRCASIEACNKRTVMNTNSARRKRNMPLVMKFCEELGLEWRFIAGDWHLRVEGKLDIYPTNQKYCWLPTEEWGSYKDFEELQDIFMTHYYERTL